MSYQANYSTRVNTRVASDALKNIGRGIIQAAGSIRTGCEKCIVAMDDLMNKRNDFLIDIKVLKTDFECHYNNILQSSSTITVSQAKMKAIQEFPELIKNVKMTENYKAITDYPELIRGREGKVLVNSVIEESFSLVEKSLVDIQAILVTKAITECNWNILNAASEDLAQTVVVQNTDGNVIALNITAENISLDISGFCNSTCVDSAKQLVNKLDELGLKISLVSGFKHNKPGGGVLLSENKSAKRIIKLAKSKQKKAMSISIPVKVSNQTTDRLSKISIQNKLKNNEQQ